MKKVIIQNSLKNKKMRKIKYFISVGTIILSSIIITNAQEEGWVGGALLPEEQPPIFVISPESAATELPEVVDNSELPFMAPIGDQSEVTTLWSCVQWAENWYTFAYEINRLKNVSGDLPENQYHPLFTYNMLNDGLPGALTTFTDGWQIIQENGIPSFDIYDDPALEDDYLCYKYWMTDYDKYHAGMSNRITAHYSIPWNTNLGSLDDLKHWIADHGNDEETGGLAILAVIMGGSVYQSNYFQAGPTIDKPLITHWGHLDHGGFAHALTIVGYNDNAVYDLNGNSQYDPEEYGAFKVANSWGTGWNTYGGYIYVPYKLMTEEGMQVWYAFVCEVEYDHEPQLTAKISIEHPDREQVGLKFGYAQNAIQTDPIGEMYFNSFVYQGGPNDMRGAYMGSLEVGFDYGYLYLNEDVGKIFLTVWDWEFDSGDDDQILDYFSILDYRWGEEFELYCDETNVTIADQDKTVLKIDYDLIPHESIITEDLSLFSNMVSRFTPTVDNSSTLTIEDGVHIDLYDSEILINSGSSLVLEDNVIINAKHGNCKLVIDGIISIGSNVSFISEENADLEIILNYTYGEFHNSFFENAKLIAETSYWLDVIESDFSNSFIEAGRGNIYIDDCEFDHSSIKVMYTPFSTKSVQISGNTFTNYPNGIAITVESYPNFTINGNNISGYGYGVKIYNSGSANGTKLIQSNTLTENYYAGIVVYNTYATIKLNNITQNGLGVCCLNRSNVELLGVKDPESIDYTQQIEDCIESEVYASRGSFPHKFRYNSIVDQDGDCLVLYTGAEEGLDVRYNYWGSNFQPEYDLCPTGTYIWDPVWNPGTSGDDTDAESMYNNAKDNIVQEDYSAAKTEFQQIILQYPSTKFAQASLKELLVLEKLVGDDYSNLRSYYNTEPVIQSNPDLYDLAKYLSNFCEIKLENWPTAIAWFENVIQNPESLEDSIFAIIDLGYTYFLMENGGLKSAYTGNMTEHIPHSVDQFEEKRDYLLSLLPGNQLSKHLQESIAGLHEGELLQNVPNPFRGTTQIWYKLDNEAFVKLKVYDYTGKQIIAFNSGVMEKGSHYIEFNSVGLSSGIYFYSLEINGQFADSKKMTILHDL